ncbi:hypothetical protein D3C72_2353950 [compost metagenome]
MTVTMAHHPGPPSQPAFDTVAKTTGVPNTNAVTPKARFSNRRALDMAPAERPRFR